MCRCTNSSDLWACWTIKAYGVDDKLLGLSILYTIMYDTGSIVSSKLLPTALQVAICSTVGARTMDRHEASTRPL